MGIYVGYFLTKEWVHVSDQSRSIDKIIRLHAAALDLNNVLNNENQIALNSQGGQIQNKLSTIDALLQDIATIENASPLLADKIQKADLELQALSQTLQTPNMDLSYWKTVSTTLDSLNTKLEQVSEYVAGPERNQEEIDAARQLQQQIRAGLLGLLSAGTLLAALLIRELRTSQKLTQRELATEIILHKRLMAMDMAAEGIAIVDASGRITYANQALATMYGYPTAQDMVGHGWREMYEEQEGQRIYTLYKPEYLQSGYWQGEAEGLRKDGTFFPQEITLSALADRESVSIIRNLSSQRAAQQESAVLQEQFFRAQKMEAVGRMAGGIAHDFNNILAAIMGYATFLVEDLPENSPGHEFARQIKVAGERAKRLVQQILAFSRPQGIERQIIDPGTLVDETCTLLQAILPKHAELTAHIDNPPSIDANPTQISQILMNLCLNSADALELQGGRIEVKAARIAADAPILKDFKTEATVTTGTPVVRIIDDAMTCASRLQIGTLKPANSYLRLTISDNGSGMPRNILLNIFEPFFTTKSVGKGTGLGLAAVHGIVSAYGGAIAVETAVGHGTSFNIFLPAAEETTPVQDTGSTEKSLNGHERILLVDDEDQVASMLAHALERLGYEVACCGSGDEAVEILEEMPDSWDLVLTDHMMPNMTGLELAQAMQIRWPHIPVVLCSGYREQVGDDDLHKAGVMEILSKPADLNCVAATLRQVLNRKAEQATT